MVVADDIDKLDDWVCSQGWKVRTDASGYRRYYTPDGTYVVRYPNTPGNKGRRYLDVLTALRQAGLTWPPLSKKELRAQRRKEGGS